MIFEPSVARHGLFEGVPHALVRLNTNIWLLNGKARVHLRFSLIAMLVETCGTGGRWESGIVNADVID